MGLYSQSQRTAGVAHVHGSGNFLEQPAVRTEARNHQRQLDGHAPFAPFSAAGVIPGKAGEMLLGNFYSTRSLARHLYLAIWKGGWVGS